MTQAEKKRSARLLKQVKRNAAFELEKMKEIPGTPDGLDYFYKVMEAVFVHNEPERIMAAETDNRITIGLYCMVVPEELIYAAGALPVRLCFGSFDTSRMGDERVPRDACPLVKSSMGASMQQGLRIFDRCDVMIVPTMCDSKRKLGEELSSFRNVWILEVPHVKNSQVSRRIWLEQIYALKNQLEQLRTGSESTGKITKKSLGRAITNSNRAQAEIRKLISFRASLSPVIWGRQAMMVENSYAYAPVEAWTEALSRLNRELSEKAENRETVCVEATPRILIAGSPSIFPNTKVTSLIEEMGGVVVYDESCLGDRYLYDPVGSVENNLREQMISVASRYMAPCVCPTFAPNSDRLIMIERMAASHQVDGVVYHVLKGCIIYDFEVHRVEKSLKTMGIPLLRVETDYNPEDVEQLRTRVEAFLEMLKSGKKKRKKVLS